MVLGEVEKGMGGLGEGTARVPDEVDFVAGALVGEVNDVGVSFAEGAILGPVDARDKGDDVAVAEVLESGEKVLTAFKDNVGLETGVLAENVNGAQDVFGLWGADEGGVAEVGEVLRVFLGEGAVEGREDDVFVGAEDEALTFFRQGAGIGDGEIDLAVQELFFESGTGANSVMDDEVRVGFDEGGQPIFDIDGIDRSDGDGVGLLGLKFVDLSLDVIELAEDGLGVSEEDLAVIVQDDISSLSVKELGAKLVLDAGEGVGERWLRDTQLVGGVSDMLAFGDGDKVLKLQKIHERFSFSDDDESCLNDHSDRMRVFSLNNINCKMNSL